MSKQITKTDNILGLPRSEDVKEIDIGSHKIMLTTITLENHDYLVRVALSMYLGERCKFCGKTYETLDDLEGTVYAGDHEHGRLACGECWEKNGDCEQSDAEDWE